MKLSWLIQENKLKGSVLKMSELESFCIWLSGVVISGRDFQDLRRRVLKIRINGKYDQS